MTSQREVARRDPKTGILHGSNGQEVTRWLDGSRNWALPTRDFGRP